MRNSPCSSGCSSRTSRRFTACERCTRRNSRGIEARAQAGQRLLVQVGAIGPDADVIVLRLEPHDVVHRHDHDARERADGDAREVGAFRGWPAHCGTGASSCSLATGGSVPASSAAGEGRARSGGIAVSLRTQPGRFPRHTPASRPARRRSPGCADEASQPCRSAQFVADACIYDAANIARIARARNRTSGETAIRGARRNASPRDCSRRRIRRCAAARGVLHASTRAGRGCVFNRRPPVTSNSSAFRHPSAFVHSSRRCASRAAASRSSRVALVVRARSPRRHGPFRNSSRTARHRCIRRSPTRHCDGASRLPRLDPWRRASAIAGARRQHLHATLPGGNTVMKASACPIRRPLSAAIALLVAGGALPVLAQDIRVDVTGSNIRRVEGEGALPVQVITRDEIDRTGAQNVAELLQYVSSNNSGGAISVDERHRRADEQRLDGVAARPRRPEHAGAAERQAPDGGVRRDPGRLRRQPRLDPVLGDRARRSPQGRRVRHLRQRRDRRRDQLHPAPGLPRRRGDAVLRRADARRRRREVERDRHRRLRRPGEGQVQRLPLGVLPEGRVARPEQAQLLGQQRRSRPGPGRHLGQHVPGPHHDRRHRHAGLPELRAGHLRSHARSVLRQPLLSTTPRPPTA